MWERIGASSGVIIGAIVLFVIFVVVLFLIERAGEKKKPRRRKVLYLVPKQQGNAADIAANAHAHKRYDKRATECQATQTVRRIETKKIV